ncbi:hypothetical protein CLAFUW4_11510 [Fulvia fulva]|uniref:Uncharacterized protein n=1 Tax=Passalora fulva TaxID=5499 RepID=A0A9Q8PCE1_PASFU|nr:uncharacterized protein CLAFUR5_10553 [Fulvia fulva]KAK4620062.1 hypothetical protein CLAFUR4_11516 [Fulvia fulva]KAK4620265.1 hypothetical protein CLAFUR0_11524 [Fulvia fulva]UJO19888.1 hypothetical protein CLAFUR5_10553 [Fulvia fulva]WPV17548.1 hypothetical protein CLAFUW4_11510 [Fulvia fulva]WPV32168.1 hypothetical protein CLAFUW7_11515 [Fulvia fulva]
MSLEQLLSHFDNLQLQNAPTHTHVVELVCPACNLLPDRDTVPCLDPPKYAAYMSRPPKNPASLGLIDTSFHAIVSSSIASGLLAEDGAHGELLKGIEDLVYVAGRSKLAIVPFFDRNSRRFITRFQLETITKDGQTSTRTFDLGLENMEMLFDAVKSNGCISMVRHLLSRESLRAYYHVRGQLSDWHGYSFVRDEEASWDVEWASSHKTDVEHVFLEKLSRLPCDAACGMESVRYILPCGHELSTTHAAIAAMSEDDCASACCQICGTRFLTGAEVLPYEVRLASKRCKRAARIHDHWTKLDRSPSPVKYGFDGKTLLDAIRAALRGFATFELISPASQSVPRHGSIAAIMEYLERILAEEGSIREEMPETMVVLLIDDILKRVRCNYGQPLIETSLPPGCGQFFRDWMLRAVNFVTDRKCDPPACRPGIHRHDRELVYGCTAGGVVDDGRMPLTRSIDEGQKPTGMEDLQAELAEMDLERTSSLHKELAEMEVEQRPKIVGRLGREEYMMEDVGAAM